MIAFERHGGTVVAVDGQTLMIEEMGQWTSASIRPTRTSITITPETRIQLLERSREPATDDRLGSFKASPFSKKDLRAGDYVTITTESTRGRLVATSISVVRPTGLRPEPKAHIEADMAPSDRAAQPQARGSGSAATPPRSGEPAHAQTPIPTEKPARSQAADRSEDASAVIDWFLNDSRR